jgi:hypothetical protein
MSFIYVVAENTTLNDSTLRIYGYIGRRGVVVIIIIIFNGTAEPCNTDYVFL